MAGKCTMSNVTPDNTLSTQEQAAGWSLLFDGKTLNGWGCTNADSNSWKVVNGALEYDPARGNGFIYSKGRYGDFELKIDFMVDHNANSGVFFRLDNVNDTVQTGIEMQVLDGATDEAKSGKHSCGAIYDCLAPSEPAVKPALEWNTALLQCSGNFISVTLNGKRVIKMNLNRWTEPNKNPDGTPNKFSNAYKDMPKVGHIGMQDHGCKVWYKNIKIREL